MPKMLLLLFALAVELHAQTSADGIRIQFHRTQKHQFPSDTDSNSPLWWADGQLHIINSWGAHPVLSKGPSLRQMQIVRGELFEVGRNGGRWMEAVVQDDDGTLFGFYHNEPQFINDPLD